MKLEWAQSIRDQCQKNNVPFFFKQWGGRTPKAGGRELDGKIWDEMPLVWQQHHQSWREDSRIAHSQITTLASILLAANSKFNFFFSS
jgi:hypothetical protein